MSNKVTISRKQVSISLLAICLLTISIVGLNYLDAERKFSQFIQLKTKVEHSKYPPLLKKLTNSFNIKDTIKLKEIRKSLQLINQEFEEIHHVELFIKSSESFYLVEQHQYYERVSQFLEKEVLSQKNEERINYLNEKENYNDREFFKIMNERRSLNLMLKVSNNAFLSVSRYRN